MKHIVVTGAAGFIGRNLARRLNEEGSNNLILVDQFNNPAKQPNLEAIQFARKIERAEFIAWFKKNYGDIAFVFHLGARTDTTEFNFETLRELNLDYSKALWDICVEREIPIIYASSAATYGLGKNGFSDNHAGIKNLEPLNPYGLSKQLFDLYVLEQKAAPPFWVGLKFFNVFGPYEFHKGRMASVCLHAFRQISETGMVKLFESHKAGFKDGEQLRDFIYMDEAVDICLFLYKSYLGKSAVPSAIYNAGTGKAHSFNQLVEAIFAAMKVPVRIEYIPIPADIRDTYQYFTEAKMEKLISAGYSRNPLSLAQNVEKYTRFLQKNG